MKVLLHHFNVGIHFRSSCAEISSFGTQTFHRLQSIMIWIISGNFWRNMGNDYQTITYQNLQLMDVRLNMNYKNGFWCPKNLQCTHRQHTRLSIQSKGSYLTKLYWPQQMISSYCYLLMEKQVLGKLLLFIDGKAGVGKTFLINAMCDKLRSINTITLPTATSTYAAQLYCGGRTTHSTFKMSTRSILFPS